MTWDTPFGARDEANHPNETFSQEHNYLSQLEGNMMEPQVST